MRGAKFVLKFYEGTPEGNSNRHNRNSCQSISIKEWHLNLGWPHWHRFKFSAKYSIKNEIAYHFRIVGFRAKWRTSSSTRKTRRTWPWCTRASSTGWVATPKEGFSIRRKCKCNNLVLVIKILCCYCFCCRISKSSCSGSSSCYCCWYRGT